MTHPANMTDAELREWHQHIRTAIISGAHWESAHHRADRFIEMGRERQIVGASEPAHCDPGPLPEWAPPLPKGAVYIGFGGSFCASINCSEFDGWVCDGFQQVWRRAHFLDGRSHASIYAVPTGSAVARALGLGGAK